MKLWLNVAEGAEYAGVCRDLVYDACAARRMHHIRVGGRRAIRLNASGSMRGSRGTLSSLRMDHRRCVRKPASARGRTAGHERAPDHPPGARAHDNGR